MRPGDLELKRGQFCGTAPVLFGEHGLVAMFPILNRKVVVAGISEVKVDCDCLFSTEARNSFDCFP